MRLERYYGHLLLRGSRNNPSFAEARHDLDRAEAQFRLTRIVG